MSKIEVDAIDKQSGSTLTLGGSGTAVTLACGATQTGFGRTGTVDWNTTPKTTGTFSAVSGDGFFLNTSGGVITANLPAGTPGAIVSFADYAGTWQTNKVTVVPNGSDKIGSQSANAILNTEGQSVTFVFVDSTQGWINTMDSTSNVRGSTFICASVSGACNTLTTVDTNFKLATFTGPGTFTVNSISNSAANNVVSYVVVGGGGGGGRDNYSPDRGGGGAGAGGYREGTNTPVDSYTASPIAANAPTNAITVSTTSYPIQVGGGGPGGSGTTPSDSGGTQGVSSTFSTITSAGGGGGMGHSCSGNTPAPITQGGSGGGFQISISCAGLGNTPPTTPAQGNNAGAAGGSPGYGFGGGGGAGGVGGTASPPTTGGTGGVGTPTQITGSAVSYAGGGGSNGVSVDGGASPCGTGGAGGGTNAGTTNRGGGGGGNKGAPAGNGGSGIVIIRYKFQ